MSEILQPTGTISVDKAAADRLFFTNGSTRMLHTAGASSFNAPDVFSATATVVKVPDGVFNVAGATFDALTVPGVTTLVDVDATTLSAAGTIATNTLQAINTATDTLVVNSKTIRLEADVQVTGRIDVVSTQTMSLVDDVIQLGAIDADANGVTDANDLTRDGAGIVIPGPPVDLPVSADAAKFEHSLKWRVHGGDFNPDGTAVVPQLKPMWTFAGGAVSIASPDASSRIARFVFAPYFTASAASLGLYYAVGADAYLVQSFSTTPLPTL